MEFSSKKPKNLHFCPLHSISLGMSLIKPNEINGLDEKVVDIPITIVILSVIVK